jgi:hypothetical protein
MNSREVLIDEYGSTDLLRAEARMVNCVFGYAETYLKEDGHAVRPSEVVCVA